MIEKKGVHQLNKKSYRLTSAITTTFVLFLSVSSINVSAESINDLKVKQQQLNQKKSELNSTIQEKSTKIHKNKTKIDHIMEQVTQFDKKILNVDQHIKTVLEEIDQTTSEVNHLKLSIDDLQTTIDKRDQLLQQRARAIQENGGSVGYVDVFLKSKSFVDFIDRISAVKTLLEADRQIIQEQSNDQKKLEEKKATLEEKLQKQEKNHDQLSSLKKTLDDKKKDKNRLIDKLEAVQSKLKSQKKILQKQYSEAINVSQKVQNNIEKEQTRLAKIARAQAVANSSNNHTVPSTKGETENIPEVASGTWTKPTNGMLTSGFGWRNLGFGPEFHYGVDLANREGTPIVAAADGVVFRASPLSTYGNVIMITHSINGQTFTTVYAHLSGYQSTVGQSVKKGQVIGYMGHTGRAYGSHLHFEIHTTAWKGQSVGAVNPLRYISL